MANIAVTEKTFQVVAAAAQDAQRAGYDEQARELDKLARMVNLALSSNNATARAGRMFGFPGSAETRSWRDVPSTLNPR